MSGSGGGQERHNEGLLFERLCELPADAQAAMLATIAAEDRTMAARLHRLLALDAAYAAHTARSVAPQGGALSDVVGDIGAFRLIRQIGRGGMGVVHLAERREGFSQQVAIKLMPRFAVDMAERERFARERQLLAQLQHPHICSILDGGELADGTPWLAMEYLRGETLCARCERERAPLEDRIDLFLQLCDAVQYAHRNLVIHRDLKDSNVMVDEHGQVKLLDFGIARSLGTAAAETRTAAENQCFSLMTAAPEQIRNERATVAVDIYALGALLHRLLTGALPFERERDDPVRFQRAVLEYVPPRMSDTLRQAIAAGTAAADAHAGIAPARLRGELDAIVAHCLRKAPSERYPDVAELARDLRAWRSNHPLSIADNDRLYRARKFLRRHRTAVAFASIALISVFAALAVTALQADRLREQRDAARAARAQSDIDRDRARAVAAFMRQTFEQADPGKASEDSLMARDLLERGKRRLAELEAQPDIQADLALLIAESEADLGLFHKSDATFRAHAKRIAALSADDPDVRWRAAVLQMATRRELDTDSPRLDARLSALARIADTPERQARIARERERLFARRSAYADGARALETAWRTLGSKLSPDAALRLRIDLGHALLNAHRSEDARRVCEEIDRDALRRRDPAQQLRAWRLIARELDGRGVDRAERMRAVAAWRDVAERFYGNDSLEAASAYVWAVGVSDDPRTQETLMRRAYAIQTAKLPPVSMARAYAEFNMASYFLDLRGSPAQAEPHLAQAVALGRRAASRAHGDVRLFEATWARVLNALGLQRHGIEALSAPPMASTPEDMARLSALRLELAAAALALGRSAQAQAEIEAVRALWQGAKQAPPPRLAERIDAAAASLGRRGSAR